MNEINYTTLKEDFKTLSMYIFLQWRRNSWQGTSLLFTKLSCIQYTWWSPLRLMTHWSLIEMIAELQVQCSDVTTLIQQTDWVNFEKTGRVDSVLKAESKTAMALHQQQDSIGVGNVIITLEHFLWSLCFLWDKLWKISTVIKTFGSHCILCWGSSWHFITIWTLHWHTCSTKKYMICMFVDIENNNKTASFHN